MSLGHGWDNKPIIETVISNSSCTTTLNKIRHDSYAMCVVGEGMRRDRRDGRE